MYALLLLAAITANRQGDHVIVQAPAGEYENVTIQMDGDPEAVVEQLSPHEWQVTTDSNTGLFDATQCDEDSCRIVREAFAAQGGSLAWTLGLSVLVGVLMNFMPCVLPVLGLKLVAFQKPGLKASYMAGVMLSFMVLATLAVVLGSGLSHMSMPAFRACLVVVTGAMGLSLLGLVELPPIPGGRQMGAFGTGLTTVALGSSCSVPFLAPVLLYSASAAWWETYLIFIGVGVGFLGPFVFPSRNLISFFRPWALKIEVGSGVAMMAVCGWMIYTLDATMIVLSMVSLICLYLALQMRARQWSSSMMAYAGFVVYIVLIIVEGIWPRDTGSNVVIPDRGPVAIVVGADWCTNCGIVHRHWHSQEVQDALDNVVMDVLDLDWTNGDIAITEFLKSHGHDAVPFALVIREDGSTHKLSGMYSVNDVVEAIGE